ncbi:Methoprene-tolerant homolog-2, partial [Operophtera brumata]
MVPPVVAASRKIDKTGVLRLTAHYLRAHQYALLSFLNGFLLTTTYKGLVVVVSQNVNEYLGYTELDLIGQNILNLINFVLQLDLLGQNILNLINFVLQLDLLGQNILNLINFVLQLDLLGQNILNLINFVLQLDLLGQNILNLTHEDDRQMLKDQLMPKSQKLGTNGELLMPEEAEGRQKKLGQRSEPCKYVTCHVEGSLRNAMESYKMEYRTRHSIDGEIIQCEQRIALVTGYMTHEVNGVNAMNFIHRDEVRWVIVALREMYNQNLLIGESCYRLMTKNGQFIYMRTRGRLEIDDRSRAVTSFACTNTTSDNEAVAVEDPRNLERVILHLVTNLPSQSSSPEPVSALPTALRLALIPPKKERIVSAIEKIYTVIKTIPKNPSILDITDEGFIQPRKLLPFDHIYLQTQRSTQTDTPSDCEYIPMDVAYDRMVPFNNNEEPMKFQMFPPQNTYTEFPDMPGPSAAGMKRHKNFDQGDLETSTKKKDTGMSHEQISGRSSPSLETFFDE